MVWYFYRQHRKISILVINSDWESEVVGSTENLSLMAVIKF
jgi:hypothetical protein